MKTKGIRFYMWIPTLLLVTDTLYLLWKSKARNNICDQIPETSLHTSLKEHSPIME